MPNIGDTITIYEYLLVYCSVKPVEDDKKGYYLNGFKKSLASTICEQLFGETIDLNLQIIPSRVPKRAGGVEKAALYLQWGRRNLSLFQATKALSESREDYFIEMARFIQVINLRQFKKKFI